MKLRDLLTRLEEIQAEHGDVYVAIRHVSEHEFGPADDLTNIEPVKYDPDANMAVLTVRN